MSHFIVFKNLRILGIYLRCFERIQILKLSVWLLPKTHIILIFTPHLGPIPSIPSLNTSCSGPIKIGPKPQDVYLLPFCLPLLMFLCARRRVNAPKGSCSYCYCHGCGFSRRSKEIALRFVCSVIFELRLNLRLKRPTHAHKSPLFFLYIYLYI